ncbi:MAG: efflux RND transporter permease subunit, partial [Polyangiales bacterium]
MNLSAVAIKRPVFTVMMAVALLVLGWVGFTSLGTDLFPDVSFPVVAITVPYPGASPTEVESLVTKPIEDAVVGLNQIDRVRSFSREGVSQVIVMFKLGRDISDAATEVRERVAGIRYKFPNDTKEPTINRFDVSATPILTYTLSSKTSLSAARKYAEDVLKPALEQVEGVAVVDVKGGATREIRVELDRAKIDALKLDPGAIVMRLQAANLNVPAGHYDEGTKEVSVRTVGDFANVEQIRDTIVATAADGSTVRLRDVAKVEDGFADKTVLVRSNGDETVSLEVLKQSGTNTINVADAVKVRLGKLQTALPADLAIAPILDQSRFIRENVHEVETAIIFGGAMAILIILVFMLDLRSTMISAVALPTSVIGTFFVMYVLGYTLNMMTLLGLSLAIGLLIDDAVVVRENIFKHLERGKSPAQAALDGTKEISLSVLATTLTIVAVFLPVAFVKGMVGQFFRQFGITISVATILSLFVAFTLDPMLSSRFSGQIHRDPKADKFYVIKRPFLAFFAGMENVYRGMLGWAVTHKAIVGVLAIGSLFFMGFIAKLTGSEFVNAEDRGQFIVEVEMPAGTSLEETSRISAEAEADLRKQDKEVLTIFTQVEANKAKWRVVTTTKDKRLGHPLEKIQDEARAVTAKIPGAEVSIAQVPFVEGAATEAPIMIDVRGGTYEDISPVAKNLANILKKTPGVNDVRVKYSPGRPELKVEIDRQKAADLGIGVSQIALALRTAMEGTESGKLRVPATATSKSEEVPIMVRLG